MPIHTAHFGRFQDQDITEYTLLNSNGMTVVIIDYGGIITRIHVPGRDDVADVVLGFDTLEKYLNNTNYVGGIICRFANRIAGGTFSLDGSSIHLDINTPPNHLHGGFHGFDQCYWNAKPYMEKKDLCLRLYRRSPDGEGGYPGNLEITVVYRLTETNILSFEMNATTDKVTPVSIAQHSYFNLRGHDKGDISKLQLQLMGDAITEANEQLIPTGKMRPVAGSCYDFKQLTKIDTAWQRATNSFDCNYRIQGDPGILRPAALLREPNSGRVMTVATILPGLQFYDGSHLTEHSMPGKNNSRYSKCAGLCLETQHYPDAVNQKDFPSAILRPGERYEQKTSYALTID